MGQPGTFRDKGEPSAVTIFPRLDEFPCAFGCCRRRIVSFPSASRRNESGMNHRRVTHSQKQQRSR